VIPMVGTTLMPVTGMEVIAANQAARMVLIVVVPTLTSLARIQITLTMVHAPKLVMDTHVKDG
jgi:hypothetical protein